MSLDERNELWEAFNLFDSGGDGLINASELHMVMQAIGRNMSEDEVRTEIKKIKKQQRSEQSGSDEDDEELNFDEFIELISEEMNDNMTKEELKEAFQEFCLDSNDKFGFNELKETLKRHGEKMPDEELRKLFKETDYDQDGKIGFEDFVRMMMSR